MGLGTLMGCFLAFKKLVLQQSIMLQNGPLMFAATLLILVGVQILCLGLAAEILSRTYYESQGKPIYAVREVRSREEDDIDVDFDRMPRMNLRRPNDRGVVRVARI